ncbi:MAG: hypothetical protein JSU00_28975 [Acidobacteria bacterium]|nr:hypothetical protein [Acidobacteriota bacterium]
MEHPSEEQLVLHYYGESNAALDSHFAVCEACRDEYRKLQRVLNSVDSLPVPERSASYGAEVWSRLEPHVGRPARRRWFGWRRVAVAAAMALLIVGAFLAGRFGARQSAPAVATAQPVRERILLVAVGDHLERSKLVLAELSNLGGSKQGRVDISYEQRSAEDLIESSRLYRMTAVASGDRATASLLDEVERVLLDVANGPSEISGDQLQVLQKRIADTGILFKVRVYATHVGERERKL